VFALIGGRSQQVATFDPERVDPRAVLGQNDDLDRPGGEPDGVACRVAFHVL